MKIAVEATAILDMVNNLVIWASESRSLVAMEPPRLATAVIKEATKILIDEPLMKAREPPLRA